MVCITIFNQNSQQPFTQPVAGDCVLREQTAGTAQCGLFFSEYAEGSSNNKYLEIYNPTNETIDLSGYAYPNVSSAPSVPGTYEYWNTFAAGAMIAPGDVYIVAHGSASPDILAQADETMNFLSNGDDGFALVQRHRSEFRHLDVVGDWEGDPGNWLGSCGYIQQNAEPHWC